MLRLIVPDTRGPETSGRVATAARHAQSCRRGSAFVVQILLFCTIFLLSLGSLAIADTARVRVGAHEPPGKAPYGRIVFEWTAPVGYKAIIESGRLVVRFDQPFVGRLDLVPRYLRDYVSDAVIEDEGRTVAFPLKAEFGLKTYADGPTIVLDLTQISHAGASSAKPAAAASANPAPSSTASKPQAATPPAAGAPKLTVRAGDHPGFSRLVFDWTRNVDYNLDKDGNRVTVTFNQPAKLDYAALNKRLPEAVQSIEPADGNGGLGVVLTLTKDARLRHFRSGTGVVVDLLDSAPPSQAASTKPAAGSEKSAATTAARPATTKDTAKAASAPVPQSSPANLLTRGPVAPTPAGSTPSGSASPESAAAPSLDDVLAAIPALTAKKTQPAPAPKTHAPRATPAPAASVPASVTY